MERLTQEGRNTITNRPLEEYCARLEVDTSFLSGKKVLNFGCGGSNLQKDMQKIGKDGKGFVYVDIEYDPIGSHADRFSIREADLRIRIQQRRNDESRDPQLIFPEIHDHENRIFGVEGRNFLKLESSILPFEDRQFDVVLALWSTYQVPFEDQHIVFSELVRIADILHIGPVDNSDIEDLKDACHKYDSSIIFVSSFNGDDYLNLSDLESYKSLFSNKETNYKPIERIETDRDRFVLNAISRGTARIIIVRNDLLKS